MGARSSVLEPFGDDFGWSLLDSAPDATLVVSAAGRIVFVNDQAGTLFGYALGDLLGREVEDLLPAGLRDVHRHHRARYSEAPTVRSMGVGLLLQARRADGTEIPVEISLSPLRLGDTVFAMAAVRDMSERVASEDQFHRVIRTLDASDDAVVIFDADTLRIAFVNEGTVRLVGYSRDELLHMTPMQLNPNRDENGYRKLVVALQAGDAGASETKQATLRRKDGIEIAVEKTYRSAPAGRDGSSWVIGLSRDIRGRLAAEAELHRSREALREAEQVLAVADDRERIARDLHDTVIQHLFGLGLSLQSALARVDDPARTRARLEATIDGLDQTIRELRQTVFSLQAAGADPGGLRGQLLRVVAEAADGLGFDPRLQFDGPVESIDGRITEQLLPVLREALSNVAHHAHAHSTRVALNVDERVTLRVSDDGRGMPGEVHGGRGLGNMHDRARSLGGDLRCSSGLDGGTTLVWSVPSNVADDSSHPHRSAEDGMVNP